MQKEHPLSQFKYCPKCGSDQFLVNNEKSKKCQKCEFVYYFNPSASTVAIIVNDKNEILVGTRAKEPSKGTLDLPGGFADLYESGEEAIKREVKEETGLDVLEVEYQFSTTNTYVYSGFEVHTLDLVYLCRVSADQEFKANDDVAKLQLINIAELNPDAFGLQSIKQIIKKIKNSVI